MQRITKDCTIQKQLQTLQFAQTRKQSTCLFSALRCIFVLDHTPKQHNRLLSESYNEAASSQRMCPSIELGMNIEDDGCTAGSWNIQHVQDTLVSDSGYNLSQTLCVSPETAKIFKVSLPCHYPLNLTAIITSYHIFFDFLPPLYPFRGSSQVSQGAVKTSAEGAPSGHLGFNVIY